MECCVCKKVLTGKQTRFCGNVCSHKYHYKKEKYGEDFIAHSIFKCIVCEKTLTGLQSKFCSKSCSSRYYYIKKRDGDAAADFCNVHEKGESTGSCRWCGKELRWPRTSWCSTTCCNTYYIKKRRLKIKLRAIKYLGGACKKCGEQNFRVLSFHHRDPEKKEIAASTFYRYNWEEIIRPELDKCTLLCMNCHVLEHNNYDIFIGEMAEW